MRRSTHLMKSGSPGLGQSSRVVKVGTFGSRRIPEGESRQYSFTVEKGGSIEPGSEFNPNTDSISGRTATGKMFGPGGYDDYRVTGKIVQANLPSELAFQNKEVSTAGGGSTGGGSTGGGSTGGGSTGGGSTGGGTNGGGASNNGSQTGSSQNETSQNGTSQNGQQAGISTNTLLIGGGVLAAAGVAVFAMGGSDARSGSE